jgi:lysophospholipase L1-like esterase
VVVFGDSITAGRGDDFEADDDSSDGRNLNRGYAPVLNDLISNATGLPSTILNEGIGGTTASDGANRLQSTLDRNPHSQIWLIQFGTNDANSDLPSGLGLNPGQAGYKDSFKDYMQKIITGVRNAGMLPALAKIPIALGDCSTCEPFPNPTSAAKNISIREFNRVIDELIAGNRIAVAPPDFYAYFDSHRSLFYDSLHPNGIGYISMANQWVEALDRSGVLNP